MTGRAPLPQSDNARAWINDYHPPPHASRQARQESNLQPPVLETGALPIELRAFTARRIGAETPSRLEKQGET